MIWTHHPLPPFHPPAAYICMLCKHSNHQAGRYTWHALYPDVPPAPSKACTLAAGIDASGLPSDLECHHLVINQWQDLEAPQNVCIISIPSVFDKSLAPPGKHTIHAYVAGGPAQLHVHNCLDGKHNGVQQGGWAACCPMLDLLSHFSARQSGSSCQIAACCGKGFLNQSGSSSGVQHDLTLVCGLSWSQSLPFSL